MGMKERFIIIKAYFKLKKSGMDKKAIINKLYAARIAYEMMEGFVDMETLIFKKFESREKLESFFAD